MLQRHQVLEHVVHGPVTPLRRALQRLARDDAPERWQRGILAQSNGGVVAEQRVEERCFALDRQWMSTGEELMENDAQRPDVGAEVDRRAASLLRRHVGERSEAHARLGEVGDVSPGQPEVEDLHLAVVGDEHVRRLDVAMDDADMVCVGESTRDRNGDRRRPLDRERSFFDLLRQRFPLVERHRDEEAAVAGLADVVDGADVGMIERGSGACFGEESSPRLFGAECVAGSDELERDEAGEAWVLGLEDHAHAAAADLREYAVGLGLRHRARKSFLEHAFVPGAVRPAR